MRSSIGMSPCTGMHVISPPVRSSISSVRVRMSFMPETKIRTAEVKVQNLSTIARQALLPALEIIYSNRNLDLVALTCTGTS